MTIESREGVEPPSTNRWLPSKSSASQPLDRNNREAFAKLLTEEGFGVLTEIDIQATLKKKLNIDRDPYVILGACHPPSAHKALERCTCALESFCPAT